MPRTFGLRVQKERAELDVALALAWRRASAATIRARVDALKTQCDSGQFLKCAMQVAFAKAFCSERRSTERDWAQTERSQWPAAVGTPGYSGFSSSLLALSCSASLAQVCAISISRALLVLSVASRAKRRHSAARLWWSWNLGTEPSAAQQRGRSPFGSLRLQMWTSGPWLATPLIKFAWNVYRYRVVASLRR
jgi:hypothetical protein